MSIEQGLYTELTSDATVSGIVGTRVFPNLIPQDEDLPAIVYTRLPGTREVDMAGPAPFVRVRMQVDCWHTSYSGVKTLADAVRTALNGVGIASPKTLGSESVQLVILETEQDLPSIDGDKVEYRVSQDWTISYLEA